MSFNVDFEKVSELGDFLNTKSNELDSLYSDLLDLCNKIDENYKSEDSTVYLSKFRGYIRTFIKENDDIKNGGRVLNRTSSLYSNQEEKWVNSIKQSSIYDRRNKNAL